MTTQEQIDGIAEKWAMWRHKHLDTRGAIKSAILEANAALLKERETVTNTNDPKHPFYIETIEEADYLKMVSRNISTLNSSTKAKLETIARKLEYFAQCFTLTANLAGAEYRYKQAEKENQELRKYKERLDWLMQSDTWKYCNVRSRTAIDAAKEKPC